MKAKLTTLVTVWTHPESDQRFIIPGCKEDTQQYAHEHIGSDMERLQGVEEQWTDKQLDALPEYDG